MKFPARKIIELPNKKQNYVLVRSFGKDSLTYCYLVKNTREMRKLLKYKGDLNTQ